MRHKGKQGSESKGEGGGTRIKRKTTRRKDKKRTKKEQGMGHGDRRKRGGTKTKKCRSLRFTLLYARARTCHLVACRENRPYILYVFVERRRTMLLGRRLLLVNRTYWYILCRNRNGRTALAWAKRVGDWKLETDLWCLVLLWRSSRTSVHTMRSRLQSTS